MLPPASSSLPLRPADTRNTQSDTFSSMSTSLKGSASRMGRMAASGNKVAILKLSGIIIGVFIFLYYVSKLFF
ncbi:blocked early in transport 1-like protein [Verticillium dahliae]